MECFSFIFLYPSRTFGTFKVSASRIILAMHDPRIVTVIGLEVLEDNLTDGTLNTVIEPTEKKDNHLSVIQTLAILSVEFTCNRIQPLPSQ